MTAGAKTKLQVDGVISIRSNSATNDLVVLNEFEHRLWDCLARRRQTAMVCELCSSENGHDLWSEN